MAKQDIRAGRAYIELFVKQSALVKGLRDAQRRLTSLGTSIASIGGMGAAAGSAILAPLAGAINHFANVGDQLDKMSGRTGVGASALAELGFAAEQSGSNIETVEKGLKGLSTTLQDAAMGSQTAIDNLAAVGLTLADLQVLTPDEQLQRVADALSEVEDASTRGALAQRLLGKAGRQLMPMYENLAALREEARDLNIVPSDASTKAAAAMADAFNRARRSVSAVVYEVGASLAPAATEAAGVIQQLIKPAIQWVRQNGQIVRTVAAVGIALLAGGTALAIFGGGIVALGAVLGGIATLLTTLAGLLTFLLSPLALVTAALGFGVVAWLKWTESGRRAADQVATTLGNLRGIATDTIGGIGDALMAGDLELAGRIAVTGLQLALIEGFDAMGSAIGGLWGDALKVLGQQLAAGDLAGAWQTMLSAMHTMFSTWASRVLQGWAATVKQIAASMAMFSQEDADEFEQKELERRDVNLRNLQHSLPEIEKNVANAELEFELTGTEESAENLRKLQHQLEITRRAIADLQAGGHGIVVTAEGLTFDPTRGTTNIQDVVQGAIDDMIDRDPLFVDLTNTLNDQIAEAEQNMSAAAAGGGDRTAELREQLDLLRRQAAEAAERAAAERAARSGAMAPGADDEDGPGGFDLTAARNQASVTFSAAALAAMGQGGGPQERIAKATEEVAKLTRRQIEAQRESDAKLIRAIESTRPAFT